MLESEGKGPQDSQRRRGTGTRMIKDGYFWVIFPSFILFGLLSFSFCFASLFRPSPRLSILVVSGMFLFFSLVFPSCSPTRRLSKQPLHSNRSFSLCARRRDSELRGMENEYHALLRLFFFHDAERDGLVSKKRIGRFRSNKSEYLSSQR